MLETFLPVRRMRDLTRAKLWEKGTYDLFTMSSATFCLRVLFARAKIIDQTVRRKNCFAQVLCELVVLLVVVYQQEEKKGHHS